MILENIQNSTVGLLKLSVGDLVYLNSIYGIDLLDSFNIILSIEKLNTKSIYSTYKFYEFRSNRIRTYYLDPTYSWVALQLIIRK